MKRLFILLVLVSLAFGQGWNTWNTWNSWLGNRLGANLVANGDFHDFTIDYPSIGEPDPFYESDFSAGTDGWIASNGTASAPETEPSTSETSTLKYYADNTDGYHYIKKSNMFSGNQFYKITFKIYIPSTNTNLKKVKIFNVFGSNFLTINITDSWVDGSLEIEHQSSNDSYLRFYGLDASDNTIWTGAGSSSDDIFYVKDIKVQRVGLVAWWQFDSYYHAQEGTGKTILQDLSGNGYDLTASTGFDYTNQMTGDDPTYKNGNAVEFDGVDDYAYIPAADADAFNPKDGDFSITGWVNFSTNNTNSEHLIAKMNSTGYWAVYLNGSTGQLQLQCYDGANSLTVKTVSDIRGGMHFISFIREGGTLSLYLDGTFVTSVSGTLGDVSVGTDNNLWVGWDGGSRYSDMMLPVLAYFNRALSATEVKALYGKPKYWTWNETGSLSRDGWSPVLSSGAELTQNVTGLDANRSYKEHIRKDGVTTATTVTGVTSKTYTLTDGTYEYVKLQRK